MAGNVIVKLRNSRGYSLAEVFTAMAILSTVTLIAGYILTSTIRTHERAFNNDDAYAIAREKLAQFQKKGVPVKPTGNDTVPRNNVVYYRSWVVTQDTSTFEPAKSVVTVSWLTYGTTKNILVSGFIACSLCPNITSNTPPSSITLSNNVTDESAPVGSFLGLLSVIDADSSKGDMAFFELKSGTGSTNNSKFKITDNSIITDTIMVQGTYSIRIQAKDCNGATLDSVFTIIVNGVPTPPNINAQSFSIDENSSVGTTFGPVIATPANIKFHLLNTNPDFDIDSTNGNLIVKSGANMDHETNTYDTLTVYVTNPAGSDTDIVTITIADLNEAPTSLTYVPKSVKVDDPVNSSAGYFIVTDPDSNENFSYLLYSTGTPASADNSNFILVDSVIKTNVSPVKAGINYVTVQVSDNGGLTITDSFQVAVDMGNMAPTDIALSSAVMPVGIGSGSLVGILTGTDPNAGDTLTFAKTGGGSDASKFFIVEDSLFTNSTFSSVGDYFVEVKVTDQGGLFYTEMLTISVQDTNDAPTDIVITDGGTAYDTSSAGEYVATFGTVDPNTSDNHTYSFAGGPDDGKFTINTNKLYLATGLSSGSYTIKVKTTDDGMPNKSFIKSIVITVLHVTVNSAPTDILLSNNTVFDTSATAGSLVGTFSTTDPDAGDLHTYTFSGGADDAKFTISGNALKFAATTSAGTYTIKIKSTDNGSPNLSVTKTFTITVKTTIVSHCTCPSGCASVTPVSGGAHITTNGCYFYSGSFPGGSAVYSNWANYNVNGSDYNGIQWTSIFPAKLDGGYYIHVTLTYSGGYVDLP